MLLNLFQGFCMALADSVPGVSGGTVAFVLGFYEQFIGALHSLFGKNSAARRAAFLYLAKLGVGWGIGLLLSVSALSRLFESHIYFLSSLFLGLPLAAIPFIVQEEKRWLIGKYRNLPFAALGLLLVCILTFFRALPAGGGAVNFAQMQPLQYGYLLVSGALAVMAMVLPGVSGSTLLLIMGVYLPAVSAIYALLRFDLAVLPGLMALGLGIIAGAALSIHSLRNALRRYRSQMLYLILGLMLGSAVSIVMGPATLLVPREPLSLGTFQPGGFLLGVGILFLLEWVKKAMEKKERPNRTDFMGMEEEIHEKSA